MKTNRFIRRVLLKNLFGNAFVLLARIATERKTLLRILSNNMKRNVDKESDGKIKDSEQIESKGEGEREREREKF